MQKIVGLATVELPSTHLTSLDDMRQLNAPSLYIQRGRVAARCLAKDQISIGCL